MRSSNQQTSAQEQSIYTLRERTVRRYTVNQAIESAKRRLKEKGINQVCVNAVSDARLAPDEMITLEQMNNLASAMFDDSMFYEYG